MRKENVFVPYRWKSVFVHFGDMPLQACDLPDKDRETLKSYTFGGKRVIDVGHFKAFGRKRADTFALKLKDVNANITIEPAEQVFYRAYIDGYDKDALLLSWLSSQFGSVTLSEDIDDIAAAEVEPEDVSVTLVDACENCGVKLTSRRGAKTCSSKCRKALSRKAKK